MKGPHDFNRRDLLRWLYVGRMTLTTGFWVALLWVWPDQTPENTRLATLMVTAAFVATAASFWYTHILGREPGHNFLYGYVVFDVALVTAIVHIMADPTFVPTYIVVITEGALLLPLPGGCSSEPSRPSRSSPTNSGRTPSTRRSRSNSCSSRWWR